MKPEKVAPVVAFVEALCGQLGSPSAYRAARILDQVGADLSRLTATSDLDLLPEDVEWAAQGIAAAAGERARFWTDELQRLERQGIEVVTAGMPNYPTNLRLVPNRPPLLFVKGALLDSDERAIAVVGTRAASVEGREKALRVATELAKRDVTVVSGLADGIDVVAHSAAVAAGGRTVAVLGAGLGISTPAAKRGLFNEVIRNGACVSQWWPQQGATKWTFPLRNIVTSGLSLGTIVIEASETSGARLQALDARRHGRRLFLLKNLVTDQPWARALVGQPGVHVVERPGEIVELIDLDLGTHAFSLS